MKRRWLPFRIVSAGLLTCVSASAERLRSPCDASRVTPTDAPYTGPEPPAFSRAWDLEGYYTDKQSMKSSLKIMRVQPKVDAIRSRDADLRLNGPKRAEMNVEMIALYKAEWATMFGGCLPLLLQTPLLFAYMAVLRNAPELHQAHWLWLTDLSSPDPLHILPLRIITSMLLTQFITPVPTRPALEPTELRPQSLVISATLRVYKNSARNRPRSSPLRHPPARCVASDPSPVSCKARRSAPLLKSS
jgi:YidC/Oxa1 family membrane protein insertase